MNRGTELYINSLVEKLEEALYYLGEMSTYRKNMVYKIKAMITSFKSDKVENKEAMIKEANEILKKVEKYKKQEGIV